MTAQYKAQELKAGLSLAVMLNLGRVGVVLGETPPVPPRMARPGQLEPPRRGGVLIWAGRMRATVVRFQAYWLGVRWGWCSWS
ncbi:MAG: hypothetical protein CM15mP89_5210 [Gammaproteobacteria bacterium]|nr:MAG: hypothetical protein CM15mP89_5210 [Gammaproteobacteria bacterium]